jgi:cell division protein FtsW
MLRPGQIVFLCALALLTLGVVMVSSAGMNIEPVEVVPVGAPPPTPPDQTAHSLPHALTAIVLTRPGAYMALAVLAMTIAAFFPVRRLAALAGDASDANSDVRQRLALSLLCVAVLAFLAILATAYVPGLGRAVNGSHRWISLPLPGLRAISVQPSELVKWGLIVVMAVYGASRARLMPSFFKGLVPGLIAIGVVAGAVAHEDLGTGVLIASVAAVVLLAAGARLWHFLMFIPPAAAGFVLLVIMNPYRINRLTAFLNPYADPQGTGYHMIQSMSAVANGEGFGRGLGYGLQKFGYLPEDTTDFLFAVISEELGIAGAAVVVALYAALLWAGLAIVRRQRLPVLKLMALGIISTVGLQSLINLAVVTGVGPTKGIALPLVSSGGTGWILTAFCLGLLVAMDRAAESPSEAVERETVAPIAPAALASA